MGTTAYPHRERQRVLLTGLLPDSSTDPAIETATDSIEAGRSGVIVAPVGVRPPLLASVSSRASTPH